MRNKDRSKNGNHDWAILKSPPGTTRIGGWPSESLLLAWLLDLLACFGLEDGRKIYTEFVTDLEAKSRGP